MGTPRRLFGAMDRAKRKLVFELIGFLCGVIVVVISASSMKGVESRANLLGVIVGSFGAGAALVNAIRDYSGRRRG